MKIEADATNNMNLALDPNLITLPLYSTSVTPTTNATAPAAEPREGLATAPTGVDEEPPSNKAISDHMITNPYEIFNHMPLDQLIPLIVQQRGTNAKFSDLSEADLEREIEGARNSHAVSPAQDNIQVKGTPEQPQSAEGQTSTQLSQTVTNGFLAPVQEDKEVAPSELLRTKKEIMENLNLAINESSLALEFVSLLLSSVRESVAISSMSPYLKKTVPLASLNSDKTKLEPKTVDEEISLAILSKGAKLKGLNESRALLKDSYSKIERTIEKEHAFWQKISQNISNKDVIFKMKDKTTGKRSLAIKYGYGDSGSTYKYDKGVVSLRSHPETNELELVPISRSENGIIIGNRQNIKFIRVRIYTKLASEDDYVLSGESAVDDLFTNKNKTPLDSAGEQHGNVRQQIAILKAALFEEELMYQIKKECSLLISYGVIIENDKKVVIELPTEKLEIEAVSMGEDPELNHAQDVPKVNDKRATLILILLRLLQVAMYKKNLKHRLTSSKQVFSIPPKDVLLVRPILGKLRHHFYKVLVRKILKDYVLDVVDGSSMVETKPITTPSETMTMKNTIDRHLVKLTTELAAYDELLNTPSTDFKVLLPQERVLILQLTSPNYCNASVSIVYTDPAEDVSVNTSFTELKEAEEFLHFIVSEYVSRPVPPPTTT